MPRECSVPGAIRTRVSLFSFSWRLLRGQSAKEAIIKRKGPRLQLATLLVG